MIVKFQNSAFKEKTWKDLREDKYTDHVHIIRNKWPDFLPGMLEDLNF